jgi:hypothetical protein
MAKVNYIKECRAFTMLAAEGRSSAAASGGNRRNESPMSKGGQK